MSNRSIRAGTSAPIRWNCCPGNWFVPYLAYDRDANSGTGVMAFVAELERVRGADHV